ncbi:MULTISPECIES: amino acid kinase family protein [unclassified Streptomyces]|uniref:amino acid kinase family protein n=1 Tax=unclassified Streptomyces TaxID=2593676 RepID=UPI0033BF5669
MALIVQKYGGSSIPSLDRIKTVARRIAAAHHAGHAVVVVMSAMGGATDQLLTDAQNITAAPPPRELDALLASGEQASNALTAMALNALGAEACSFTGWQAGTSPRTPTAAPTSSMSIHTGSATHSTAASSPWWPATRG